MVPEEVLQAWAAAGGYLPGSDFYTYVPAPDTPHLRYCECACSQKATADEPCWNCGGKTTRERPKWWPNAGTSQTVYNGDTFSVSDLDEAEAA